MKNLWYKIHHMYELYGPEAFLIIVLKGLYYILLYPFTKLIEYVPFPIKRNRLLFMSDGRVSDNAKALFDYLVETKIGDKYEMIWLVTDRKQYEGNYGSNIKFVNEKYKMIGCRTLRAFYYAKTSEKVFFTHTMNWVRKRSEQQVFVNLWHGCGYKASKPDAEPIRFDYCMVPGELFVETKREFFQCDPSKIVVMGYPRYDMMINKQEKAYNYIESMKENRETKVVMWMPTFRKSTHANLTDDSLRNSTGLPLISNWEDWEALNTLCKNANVILLLKRHHLQMKYTLLENCSNIYIFDDEDLEKKDIQIYEVLQYTDALISDYSSIAIDYLLLEKPMAFILQDFEEYKALRGFVFENPLEYMPGEKIYKLEELENFIQSIAEGNDPYYEQREKVKTLIHGNVEKCYCEKVSNYFKL